MDCEYTLTKAGVCFQTGSSETTTYLQLFAVTQSVQLKNGGTPCPVSPQIKSCIDCVYKLVDTSVSACNIFTGKKQQLYVIVAGPQAGGTAWQNSNNTLVEVPC